MIEKELSYHFKILESVLHGVAITDLRGHILFWNRQAENILGYTKEEVSGRPVTMFYTDDKQPLRTILDKCKRGIDVQHNWFARHKDGTKVWLDIRLNVVSVSGENGGMCMISMYDIGELKFAESRLQRNMAMTQAIFDTMVDALITINEKGVIRSVNKSVTEMFGYTEKELIGANINMLMPFPHNIHHDEYMKNFQETGKSRVIGTRRELQAVKNDGSIFPIELAVSEIKKDNERMFAGIIKDISERRTLEKKMLEIGDEERRKIGRELHDGLGQMLTGVRMLADSLARRLEANALPGAAEVNEIAGMIREADEYARILARGMVVVDIEKNGLSFALENLSKRTTRISGVNVEFQDTGNTEIDRHTMSIHLFRIAQEAVSNAIKHGKARNVKIRLSSIPHHTSLIIDDDGVGFKESCSGVNNNLNPLMTSRQGAGLHIMNYRAQVMGGILEIDRTGDGITRVRCVVPNNLEYF